MKKLLLVFVFATFIFAGCKSQSQKEAIQKAKDIQTAVKENTPGSIPTTTGGWTMTAKIDGKEWKASGIMPPDRAGVLLGENNGESISLPYYDRRSFLANTKTELGANHGLAEMRLNDNIVLYTGTKGELELTKVDDNWAEGKFSFTAKGFQTDKTVKVTDGFFRISLKEK